MGRNTKCATDCGDSSDWSFFELCLFDQIRGSLKQQGLDLDAEFGVTDEHEPWLVFCNADGQVVGHFARLGDTYVACVPFGGKGTTGSTLSDVLRDFLQRLTPAAFVPVWPSGDGWDGWLGNS